MRCCFRFNYFILVSFLCLYNVSYGQDVDDYSTKIDNLIQSKNHRSFNGIVLITKKGKTKYLKTYGYSNFETKTPFTLKDNFRIQSLSKQITAVVILKEVEKGIIDLHTPIRKYLPDFKQSWADTVTVHHLLNNTSGIIQIDKPLSFKPGSEYYYSNPGYGLLKQIYENVTNQNFFNSVNKLFKKLMMHNSYCYEINKPNLGLVNGYRVDKDSITLFNFTSLNYTPDSWLSFIPAGGMISNALDLNLWDKLLHNGKILKTKTYKLMTSYEIAAQHDSFGREKVGYGYGLRISNLGSVNYLGHSGKGLGFMSFKLYFPENDVSLIVLQNHYDHDEKLHYFYESKIREIVLNSNLVLCQDK